MLEAMRSLALDYLVRKLSDGSVPDDVEEWYATGRKEEPDKWFSFLVESGDKVKMVYVIKPDPNDNQAILLDCEELTAEKQQLAPFVKPSGSQDAAVGPVIKRTFKAKERIAGPTQKILNTTLKSFELHSKANMPWSGYFGEILEILNRNYISFAGRKIAVGEDNKYKNILEAAISELPEKNTVYLIVTDINGAWPGSRIEYKNYLCSQLAEIKYTTVTCKPQHSKTCTLCGKLDTTVYANAVKGSGINIGNQNRKGAFQGLTNSNAWKYYALCMDCADLLYIFKFHVSSRFEAKVAGERSIIIPYTDLDGKKRLKFIKSVEDFYLRNVETGVKRSEDWLLHIIGESAAVSSFTIVWAEFGQNIEDVRSIITDILPSRLGTLSRFNEGAKEWRHPLFPDCPVFEFDLGMNGLLRFFKRPGGKKANHINESNRLFFLKRELISALYKGEHFDPEHFWHEVIVTALWYLNEVHLLEPKRQQWYLFGEATWKEGKEPELTFCGWIRHLALMYYYFRQREVLPMTEDHYQPDVDILKPYFGQESGIDSKEKAFAFILGTLYGKVMQVQAARGVNVGANSLTWLKRLTLEGKDLPELYNKVRAKLLTYGTESNNDVRMLIEELGELGKKLGNKIDLDQTATCYFILIGQSMTNKILPKKVK